MQRTSLSKTKRILRNPFSSRQSREKRLKLQTSNLHLLSVGGKEISILKFEIDTAPPNESVGVCLFCLAGPPSCKHNSERNGL